MNHRPLEVANRIVDHIKISLQSDKGVLHHLLGQASIKSDSRSEMQQSQPMQPK